MASANTDDSSYSSSHHRLLTCIPPGMATLWDRQANGSAVEDGEHDHHGHHDVHSRLRANSSIMQLSKILVANRGEIPIRIFRTAHELSLQTVAVYSHEDRLGMHRQKADEAYAIGKRGQYRPVEAYLAQQEIINIALEHGANMIHPGYGFLSENAEFAQKVEDAGLIVCYAFDSPLLSCNAANILLVDRTRSQNDQ